MNKKLRFFKFGILTGSVLIATTSCHLFQKEQAAPVILPSFPTVVLSQGDAMINSDYAAEVISSKEVELRSRATGYIDRIFVKEGSKVKQGETIAKLDDKDYVQRVNAAEASVLSATSAVNNANLEVEKLTPLVEKNIVSRYQLDAAKINLDAAKAALEQARAQRNDAKISLSYTTIKSPITGTVGKIAVYQGTLINIGELITNIAESGDAHAYFAFDEKKLLDFSASIQGKDIYEKLAMLPEVEFVLADGAIYSHKGRLQVASGIINSKTGSIQLKAIFPNPENTLRSGSSGAVRFPILLDSVVLVPQKATFEIQDKKMVYVYNNADSTIQSRKIDVIDNAGAYYAVAGGVAAGDIILYDGLTKVHEGMKLISAPTTVQ